MREIYLQCKLETKLKWISLIPQVKPPSHLKWFKAKINLQSYIKSGSQELLEFYPNSNILMFYLSFLNSVLLRRIVLVSILRVPLSLMFMKSKASLKNTKPFSRNLISGSLVIIAMCKSSFNGLKMKWKTLRKSFFIRNQHLTLKIIAKKLQSIKVRQPNKLIIYILGKPLQKGIRLAPLTNLQTQLD